MAKKSVSFGSTFCAHSAKTRCELEDALPLMIRCIWAEDCNIQFKAAYWVRKFLDYEGTIEGIVAGGAIPHFVELLLCDCPSLQLEAVHILEKIATEIAYTPVLVSHGAVSSFVQLLSSPEEFLRSKATRALAFLLKDLNDLQQSDGAVDPILIQLSKDNTELVFFRDTVRVLALLVDGNASISTKQTKDVLVLLNQLLLSSDVDVLVHACYALASLAHERKLEDISIVQHSVDLNRLLKLLDHSSPIGVHAALLTISNISSNHSQMRTFFVKNDVLLNIFYLLEESEVTNIQIATCLLLCSLVQGSHDLAQDVINANIISALIALWTSTAELDVRRVVACTLSDGAYYGSNHQIVYLVSQGCIPPICGLLACESFEFLTAGLERLEKILRVGEELQELEVTKGRFNAYAKCIGDVQGVEKLEGLQLHQNPLISQKALKLLETYWLEEVEGESSVSSLSDSSAMEALDQITSLLVSAK